MSQADYSSNLDLTDQDIEDCVNVLCFAISKGTANVSASDRKKLSGLMRHYAKKKHPFTACVRDNRKRFGPNTEKYCAVLKDLIMGTTKWRGKKKNFSEDTFDLNEFLTETDMMIPEDFLDYISSLSEEDVNLMTSDIIAENQEAEQVADEAHLSDGAPHVAAEMFFDGAEASEAEDGFIWKTIMREGTWKLSPGPGQKPVNKPITVVKDGFSDVNKFTISLTELKNNFESMAKDHVTIPTSHENKVLDNTGFIRKLRIGADDQGRATLEAACDFTEPDVKEKAIRGTIPNTSAGVLFDYFKKETGDKFNAVLDHVALTPNPWLNGMQPFGRFGDVETNLEIISFSEEDGKGDMSDTDNATANDEGGVIVSTLEVETKPTFFDEIGMSEDEVRERLNRYEAVEAENKKNRVDSKCAEWQTEGKSPAVITAARDALLADSGEVAVNFSEDGKTVGLTLSEVVERLVAASPNVNLADDPVNDEQVAGEAPDADAEKENAEANFSDEEKVEVMALVFDHGMSEEAAIAKVRSARESKE